MNARIHVSAEIIRKNREDGTNNPPIVVHRDGATAHTHKVAILDGQGNTCAEVVYRPNEPINGAVVYIVAGPLKFE